MEEHNIQFGNLVKISVNNDMEEAVNIKGTGNRIFITQDDLLLNITKKNKDDFIKIQFFNTSVISNETYNLIPKIDKLSKWKLRILKYLI